LRRARWNRNLEYDQTVSARVDDQHLPYRRCLRRARISYDGDWKSIAASLLLACSTVIPAGVVLTYRCSRDAGVHVVINAAFMLVARCPCSMANSVRVLARSSSAVGLILISDRHGRARIHIAAPVRSAAGRVMTVAVAGD